MKKMICILMICALCVLSVSCDTGEIPSDTEMPTSEAAIGTADSTETEIRTEIETETTAPRDPTEYTEGLRISYDQFSRKAHITCYTGEDVHVVIPSYYREGTVWKIGKSAFTTKANTVDRDVNSKIESVYIPNTVRRIEEYAFYGCDNLKSIHIPASVDYIGRNAFVGCSSLTSITVAEGNRAYRAEGNCLIDIVEGTVIAACNNTVIPDDGTVREIGENAFVGCTQMTEIHIPSSVKIIRDSAFLNCWSLKRVTGAEGLTHIECKGFEECISLEEFSFQESLEIIDDDAFQNCRSLKEARLPAYMKRIGQDAFEKCAGLETVILPDRIEFLDQRLFLGTPNLKSVRVPQGYTHLGAAFRESGLEEVYLPSSLVQVTESDFVFCESLRHIYYDGTRTQWDAIASVYGVDFYTLHCTDGDFSFRFDRENNTMIEVPFSTE